MERLAGKTALVTGGGNGIGRACVLRFAEEGARVIVADFNPDAAGKVVEEVVAAGGEAVPVTGDVSDETSVDQMVAAGIEAFSGVDILLNSAGGGSTADGAVTDLSLDEFWRTIRVDLFGTLMMCRKVIPVMKEGGAGSIINISSLRAVIGTEGADAYTASKGGVLAMSRAMAMQWAKDNIRVNVMAPGVVLTERVAAFIKPDNPIYQKSILGPAEPIDVANLALYLASDESRRVTGAVMRLDGGASIY
ncbi:SDR family NAD(P)-dependent oxidoreductase [Hoeflea poritis]|uniref:SDR family NAD(P)-dependent oxidoreductase n=1 Tax=Hoeflea poritis TaxID=2993659 RepID=A0ABT4VUG7_9HYPH|nr:SDR family NAD(P)-dependent oxidoreductase [Hoeflea poritis]MDA4848359.1 SDR family NAD(P)-dependent oxidoreductase [Hoeflea poritis]